MENAIFTPIEPFTSLPRGPYNNNPQVNRVQIVGYLSGLVCQDQHIGMGIARRSVESTRFGGVSGLAVAVLERAKTCTPPLALPDELRKELEERAVQEPRPPDPPAPG